MENLEEYTDPSDYDCEYGEPEPELSFYICELNNLFFDISTGGERG